MVTAAWAGYSQDMKDRILHRYAVLLIEGNAARAPITEALGDGLFELRGRSGTIRIRMLFGFLPGKRIVFVWTGLKDQRKLPPTVIREARRLLKEAEAYQETLNVVQLH